MEIDISYILGLDQPESEEDFVRRVMVYDYSDRWSPEELKSHEAYEDNYFKSCRKENNPNMSTDYMFGLEADNDDVNVGMDDLVKDESCPECDYKDAVNKEVVEQDPDPDKVVEADLEMDPAAATEEFISKRFGMSKEDLDNAAEFVEDDAKKLDDDDKDEDDDESKESLEQSSEKLLGYFKKKDLELNDSRKNSEKYMRVNSAAEFVKTPVFKSKIPQLKEDLKKKDLVPATLEECNNLKSTFFNKWIRGDKDTMPVYHYYNVDGIIFAAWYNISLGYNFSALAMVKRRDNKITSVGYAINIPLKFGVELSKESIDYTNFIC